MKAILIARVSTEEQKEAGNSLPAQVVRLEKYCQNKNFLIIRICSFDESAYTDQRSEFDRIIDFILAQKEKVVVCCDKVDRLSRNVFDKRISLLYEKALEDKIELHFVSDGQIINSNISAVEKFQFNISLGLAKYYSDAISDNVKRANEQKLRKGELPGKPPYGYRNITTPEGKSDIIVDDYAAQIVQKAYELYATGAYSMSLLRQKIKTEYGIIWSQGYVDQILKTHFYHGIMERNKNMYPHRYPPIITKMLFDQVQRVKASFNKKPAKFAGLPYLYRGLLRCAECDLSITPGKHKGHVYYHCTQYKGNHGAAWLREEDITQQLGQIFKRLQMPPEVLQRIVITLKEVHQNKIEFQNKQLNEITKKQTTLTKMMDNLYLDKLKGSISDSIYDRFYQTFRDELCELDARIASLREAESNYFTTANYLLNITSHPYDLFIGSQVEERRQLIKLVLLNLRVEGEKIVYEAQKPFDSILEASDCQLWCARQDLNLWPTD